MTEAVLDRVDGGRTCVRSRPAAFTAFGAERLMFGSDWPVCLLATPAYRDVLAAAEELTGELSATERDAVFGGTAQRVYRLRPPARGPALGAELPA